MERLKPLEIRRHCQAGLHRDGKRGLLIHSGDLIMLFPPTEKKDACFSGRDEGQLRWMASVLREVSAAPA